MMAFKKRNEETKTGAEKCPRGPWANPHPSARAKKQSSEETAIQRDGV
jgi:hypothetical protein